MNEQILLDNQSIQELAFADQDGHVDFVSEVG